MDIEKQFNLVAENYDRNRRKFIPCFNDFYHGTTKLICSNIVRPRRILDLGAGTGLLSACWLQHFPAADYLLADIADEMLAIARKRFSGLDNVTTVTLDYSRELPAGDFDVIISALSIHHLEEEAKAGLFARIAARLPQGGIFVNYDQYCAPTPRINAWYNDSWLEGLTDGRLSDTDLAQWRERSKLDRECSVEQQTGTLRKCGFAEVGCLYSCGKFSVIAAIK